MSNEISKSSERDRRLDAIAAAYIRVREANGPQDRQQWLNRYADLAPELESFISDYERIHPLPNTTIDFPNRASQTAPSELWQIGDRIEGRWEVYNVMAGGMGVVYVLYDHDEESPIAAKTFKNELLRRAPHVVRRFEQEAVAWIDLEAHQNVTRAEYVLTLQDQPFLFMEYVSGGDLSSQIGTLALIENPKTVLALAIQFCDGMIHVLSRGVQAHRDIKPQNCLITKTGTLKITDFGLAKVFDGVLYPSAPAQVETAQIESSFDFNDLEMQVHQMDRLRVGISQTGAAAGTCTHMAPEQFADAKHVDIRADIYSFGVMLFQMVSGKLPFRARNFEQFALMHKHEPPPHLPTEIATFWHGHDDEINQLIHECLAKNPIQRPANFGAVRNRLAKLFNDLTGESPPPPVIGDELDADQIANKAVSLVNLLRFEEAIDSVNRLLIRESLSPRLRQLAIGLRGIARQEVGELHPAEADLTTALQMAGAADLEDEKFHDWFVDMRGSVRAQIGDVHGAIEDFTRIIETPRVSELTRTHAYFMRGIQRRKTGDVTAAIADLRNVVSAGDADEIRSFKETAGKLLVELETNSAKAKSPNEFECSWCDEVATRTANFAVFDLIFPICADTNCLQSLELFLTKQPPALLMGFAVSGKIRQR